MLIMHFFDIEGLQHKEWPWWDERKDPGGNVENGGEVPQKNCREEKRPGANNKSEW